MLYIFSMERYFYFFNGRLATINLEQCETANNVYDEEANQEVNKLFLEQNKSLMKVHKNNS